MRKVNLIRNRPDLVYPQLGWCKMTPQVGIRDCVLFLLYHSNKPLWGTYGIGLATLPWSKSLKYLRIPSKANAKSSSGSKMCDYVYAYVWETIPKSIYISQRWPEAGLRCFFLEEESPQFGNGHKETCFPETDIKTKCSTSHTSHIKHKHTQAMLIHIFGIL